MSREEKELKELMDLAKYSEMKMKDLAKLLVTLDPDDKSYDAIVNEVKLRTHGADVFNGVTKGIPVKGSFRRAPEEELIDAEVPSTPAADMVRLIKDMDPSSPEYKECTNFIINKTRRLFTKKGSKKGTMVERIYEEAPEAPENNKPISEQILGLGVFLPASELFLKRDIIRLGMKVKEMEEREARIRRLVNEEK